MPEHTIAENLTRLQNAKTAIGAAITAKGGTVAAGDGLEDFAADIGTITNQYTASDEGKVVSNGALVAQTAYPSTITDNGTYDTTNYNSVTVNVPSLPTGIEICKLTPLSSSIDITQTNIYAVNMNARSLVFGSIYVNSSGYAQFTIPNTFAFSHVNNQTNWLYSTDISNANAVPTSTYSYNVDETNNLFQVYLKSTFINTLIYMACYFF